MRRGQTLVAFFAGLLLGMLLVAVLGPSVSEELAQRATPGGATSPLSKRMTQTPTQTQASLPTFTATSVPPTFTPTMIVTPEPTITPTATITPTITNTPDAPPPTPGRRTPTWTPSPVPTDAGTPVPGSNLLVNPWFQDPSDPLGAGLAGWTPWAGAGEWTCSIKGHNPDNPDGGDTAARWAFGIGQARWPTCPDGPGVPNVDAVLYQDVVADPSLTTIEFQMWWIVMWIQKMEANIYGSHDNQNWELIWTPFETEQPQGAFSEWNQTPFYALSLTEGYPYYRVELFCKYSNEAGCKFTGIWFSAR